MLDKARVDITAEQDRIPDPFHVDIGSLFREILRGARRQAPIIAAACIGTTLLALIYALTAEPQFTASSKIVIDPRVSSGPETPSAPMLLLSDQLLVDSEVEVLRSREMAGRVVDKLNLMEDPEQVEEPGLLTTIMTGTRQFLDSLLLDEPVEEPELTEEDIYNARREALVDWILETLDVSRAGSTYVINVSYTSPDRYFAAKIANTVVEEYFSLQAEATYENTRRLSEWLAERVSYLGERVLESDRAVEDYRRNESLISVKDGRLPSEAEYESSNEQLVETRNELVAVQANVRELQNIIENGFLNAPLDQAVRTSTLTELQARNAELVGRERDLSTRFGANHQLAKRAREEIAATRQQIIEEFQKILEAQTARIAILTRQEAELVARIDSLRNLTSADAAKMIRLRELEREAASNRSLYENMLAKLNQTAQEETFRAAPARIIARATPPEKKSEPRTKVIVAVGLFAGLLLGAGGAFLREQLDNVFRATSSVQDELGVPLLGIVPTFAADRRRLRTLKIGSPSLITNTAVPVPAKVRPFRFAADSPTTMFAETLRTILFTLNIQRDGGQGKVVGTTSSRKGEGKSVLSGNLATYAAASGWRVALVDFDIRARTLAQALSQPAVTPTLTELIADPYSLNRLTPDPRLGNICFITNNGDTLAHNAGSVNFVASFERLIGELRDRFDLIVIDLPPAAALVDSRIAAKLVDHMLFAVEWGATDRKIARNIVMGNYILRSKLIGAVFTKVKLNAYYRFNADSPPEYFDYVR
jgi:Uncharacterized protein involved in exopolysaccharide biosynthesis